MASRSSLFFKSAWSIVGKDFIDVILYFFSKPRSYAHVGFNSTSVTLIPKTVNPNTVKDFRPISCYSIVYKSITKVFANRLRPFMSNLIASNQSAFVPGRSITDNILMAHEEEKFQLRVPLKLICKKRLTQLTGIL